VRILASDKNVDILHHITGFNFAQVKPGLEQHDFDGLELPTLAIGDLYVNKLLSWHRAGRIKDKLDAEWIWSLV
jgi:hypothetical protein